MQAGKHISSFFRSHQIRLPAMLMIFIFLSAAVQAGAAFPSVENAGLENPVSVDYLKKNLRKSLPRLVLNKKLERKLKQKLKKDPVVRNMYAALKLNAAAILKEPLLERVMVGRRLLGTSREMLYRMNMLAMVYRMEQDPEILERINRELIAVCRFSDWNPSHFLDVAEMALAVALALDWTAGALPAATVELAETALIGKGILPSYHEDGTEEWWVKGANNWNQVCHGGMIAASIAIAEKDPELAARTIGRALDNMHFALEEYQPDGVYPEGSTYWTYGTSFSVLTSAMLESAFDTDFGLSSFPGFLESAAFKVLSIAPSGWYYNFADCGDKRSENGDPVLAWFAAKTGNSVYFEKERFLTPPEDMEELGRYDGAALVWLAAFKEKKKQPLPTAWKGDGSNPLVIFRGGEKDPHQYYFGGKGGRGAVNHGNMDAGSFIFELNGVRWVIDPGNQPYHELEKTGFDLWSDCQECERWTLLTKNNFGHSTLTIDDQLHVVDGMATIAGFKDGEMPEATIDLTATFEGQLKSAQRRFVKDGPSSLFIEDDIELTEETRMVAWQLITQAQVEITADGAILRQDGRQLKLENLSHAGIPLTVVSLDPPHLRLDKHMKDLKRLEWRIPATHFKEGKGKLVIRLSGL